MTRRAGDQAFTKNQIKRLMRTADEQGAKKYQITIGKDERDKPTYTLAVDNTEPATQQTNEVDSWLEKHAS